MSRHGRRAALVAATAVMATGCATSTSAQPSGTSQRGPVRVVAAESSWGSIASQLGGVKASITSIIDNPSADPHDYEPTPADARAVAAAQLVIVNGIGYDPWAPKLLSADPVGGRTVLAVGRLVGVPSGGNPHRWYDPADVEHVVSAMTRELQKLDPANAAYFAAQRTRFERQGLDDYHRVIREIKAAYAGTPVGASESIFALMAPALGLDLKTPPAFLKAITEGSEPRSADKATVDEQIRRREIQIYVYNSQNATPDVQAEVDAARHEGIPVATITESLTPAGSTFQDWQVRQLTQIKAALAKATGR